MNYYVIYNGCQAICEEGALRSLGLRNGQRVTEARLWDVLAANAAIRIPMLKKQIAEQDMAELETQGVP